MNRRSILAASVCVPFLGACYQPGLVNLVWNEEVQLPDGRMVVVGMVHSYHCFDYRFKQFGGLCGPLDTTLTLNGGEGVGVVWVVRHPPGYADIRIALPKSKEIVGGASGRTTVVEKIAHNSAHSFEFDVKQQWSVVTGIAAKYFIDGCCSIHAPRCQNEVNGSLWSRIA